MRSFGFACFVYVTLLLLSTPTLAEDDQATLAEDDQETVPDYPFWTASVMHPDGKIAPLTLRAKDLASALDSVLIGYCKEQLGTPNCVIGNPALRKK